LFDTVCNADTAGASSHALVGRSRWNAGTLPRVSAAVLALAGALAGTVPTASAVSSFVVNDATAFKNAVTDASTDPNNTDITLTNDITINNTVLTEAIEPATLAIYTSGGHTLTLSGDTVWDAGSYTYFAVTGSTSGGLTVSSGAQLTISDSSADILDMGAGILTVTGDGTTVTSTHLAAGRNDNTTVTVTDGAHVITRGSATLGEDSNTTYAANITVLVDGEGTVWDAKYFAAGGATNNVDVTLSGGALIKAGSASIGRNGNATMLVTGSGSTLAVSGTLAVGERRSWISDAGVGDGALTISNGGLVSASRVLLGVIGNASPDAGVTGELLVDSGGTLATGELAPELGTGSATFHDGTLRATSNGRSLIHGFDPGTFVLADEGMFLDSNGLDVVAESGMSGNGALTKQGLGTLTVTGPNTYEGATFVTKGTLAAGVTNTFSAASDHHVSAGATLALQGFDQTIASLENLGTVSLGGAPGTQLTITGNYQGDDGVILINTALGDDNSLTDRVDVDGNATGTGSVRVTNVGGTGAQTDQGIRIINVAGTSSAQFALLGDYEFEGDQAVVGGAYAYRLYQGSPNNPGDGDWYLRSTLLPDGPDPLYQAGVPLYESYPQVLAMLNQLGTLQQRVGNRSWIGSDSTGIIDLTHRQVEAGGMWARIEGAYAHQELDTTSGGTDYDASLWRLQAGLDGVVQHGERSALIGGAYVSYGTIGADVASLFGNGSITSSGLGVGGTLTWYDASGFYLDGVAQVQWFDSTLNSSTAGLDLVAGNGGFGYAVSLEAGSQISLSDGWSLTPQGQIVYSEVAFNDFADAFGTAVGLTDGGGLSGRLGVSIDHETAEPGDDGLARRHFYGIANLYYDFDNTTGVDVAGTRLTASHDQLSGGLGLGGSYNWGDDKYSLYGEASFRTGLNAPGESYSLGANAGLKARW
jgi:fibronectin-binding autotransporter adhesin